MHNQLQYVTVNDDRVDAVMVNISYTSSISELLSDPAKYFAADFSGSVLVDDISSYGDSHGRFFTFIVKCGVIDKTSFIPIKLQRNDVIRIATCKALSSLIQKGHDLDSNTVIGSTRVQLLKRGVTV